MRCEIPPITDFVDKVVMVIKIFVSCPAVVSFIVYDIPAAKMVYRRAVFIKFWSVASKLEFCWW